MQLVSASDLLVRSRLNTTNWCWSYLRTA